MAGTTCGEHGLAEDGVVSFKAHGGEDTQLHGTENGHALADLGPRRWKQFRPALEALQARFPLAINTGGSRCGRARCSSWWDGGVRGGRAAPAMATSLGGSHWPDGQAYSRFQLSALRQCTMLRRPHITRTTSTLAWLSCDDEKQLHQQRHSVAPADRELAWRCLLQLVSLGVTGCASPTLHNFGRHWFHTVWPPWPCTHTVPYKIYARATRPAARTPCAGMV